MDMNECINYIDNLPRIRHLGIIKKAMKLFNINKNYKSVIITGTNGKGSTVTYLTNLIAYKHNVGSFISPHIEKINERISYNLSDITDIDFIKSFSFIKNKMEEFNLEFSYFEFLLMISLYYFDYKKVEYVVFECGIGGINDAVNELDHNLSIITSISYDHQEKLGNTLEEIALNKLGIVKNNKLIYACSNEIYHFLWIYMLKNHIDYDYVSYNEMKIYNSYMTSFDYEKLSIDLFVAGKHQAVNATLAIKAIKYLDINIKDKKIKKILEDVFIKCRLERVNLKPLVILDGGHNIEAAKEAIELLKRLNKNVKVVFAGMKDKDISIIDEYEKIASLMAFTEFEDDRCRSCLEFYNYSKINKIYNKNYKELIIDLVNNSDESDVILITGSFYFASMARKIFRK